MAEVVAVAVRSTLAAPEVVPWVVAEVVVDIAVVVAEAVVVVRINEGRRLGRVPGLLVPRCAWLGIFVTIHCKTQHF